MYKRIFFAFILVGFCSIGSIYSADSNDKLPDVCVAGIMYDNDNSLAVVNGESLKLGQEILGIKIVNISESEVSFEYKGQSFKKRIGESCSVKPQVFVYKENAKRVKAANRKSKLNNFKSKKPSAFTMPALGLGTYLSLGILILAIIFYIYTAMCLQEIAKKTTTPYGWLAWLPIANIFLILKLAKKSFWWFLLLLIPVISLICFIIIWMEISKARAKPAWLGLLMALPFANLIVVGYLAFSK